MALATLGQDLRNSLVGLAGLSEIGASHAHPDVSRPMQTIGQGLQGALALIDDLLSFAEAVSTSGQGGPATPADILNEALAQVRSQIQRSKVVVRTILESGSDLRMHADRNGCELLLSMLLRNAIVRADHDQIRVQAKASTREADGLIQLRVEIGRTQPDPDGETEHLFALCQRVADRLGAEVERADGSWIVHLLCPPADHESGAYRSETDEPLAGQEVLVVDDDSALRRIYATMLSELGADCEEAGDGLEALQCCRRKDYDLVFMDLNMPRMDGFSAIRAICGGPESAPARDTLVPTDDHLAHERGAIADGQPNIIAITALAGSDVVDRSLRAGALTCLHKPLNRQQVVRAIQQHHDHAIRSTAAGDRSTAVEVHADPDTDGGSEAQPPPFAPALLQQTLDLMGGGAEARETIGALLTDYIGSTPDVIRELRNLGTDRLDIVENKAHTLKSRSAALGLSAARATAAELENRARDGDLDGETLTTLVDRFGTEKDLGIEALTAFLAPEGQRT